ncbi:hypothetical protein ES332_D06G079400v1 [Gossypium tomentosum]|uniref:Uncharacterized protein n=1 Tax=Gossypium tomentosum TaxID=34277 RepID=A0A5D2KFX8_GOSTO|nr:hypothetical protein ES332_D06G079400v1 [Gossypium tomentosum]
MDVKQYYLFSYFNDIILFCRAVEHPTFSALTRPLCDLYSLIPPLLVVTYKKLRFNMGNDVLSFGDLNVYGS